MFFPKLRRKAKWVFAFLALAFALAFVVAGVGSGFGSGFGDYLADLFNRQPGDEVPSVGSARERLEKNPNDPAARLALANALSAEGQTNEAIAELEKYVEAKPDDANALQTLASLYAGKAAEADQRAAAAQAEGGPAFFGSEIRDPSSKLSQGIGSDPVTQYEQEQAQQRYTLAQTEAQAMYTKEKGVWEKLTKLEPDDPRFFQELARSSEFSNDYATAIRAYQRYLVLQPDANDAEQIRERIKQLRLIQSSAPTGVTPP